ncbi:MAG: hypothetical protein Q4G08_05690 [Capnocytophaga sp.]|nr:hypothetical protein [Capnocytophaga sp.]
MKKILFTLLLGTGGILLAGSPAQDQYECSMLALELAENLEGRGVNEREVYDAMDARYEDCMVNKGRTP